MIVGNHKHKLALDDYIMGALIIYVDVIGMFLEILSLLGDKR
jgi:FtsH-binding integral membrane protein